MAFVTTCCKQQLCIKSFTNAFELDVVPPPQESIDNGPSLFNYDPYNDYNNGFDSYLKYGKVYKNKTAFKNAFYRWSDIRTKADMQRNLHDDL